jgi:hypothetical protein
MTTESADDSCSRSSGDHSVLRRIMTDTFISH